MTLITLVMAAGASRRFGDADKRIATLPDGRTLLAATVESLRLAFSDVRVVIGADDTLAALNLPSDTPLIRALHASDGMGSSIADAVRTLKGEQAQAVALCLGDMPWIRTDTLERLSRAAAENMIVRPVCQGLPGHPVLFGRAYWPDLERLEGDEGGREVIRRYPTRYRSIDVADQGVMTDLDHPTDLGASPPGRSGP
ncbi:MAG: nucleotidyltransferase family protein [Pseudomonadota bacterium]